MESQQNTIFGPSLSDCHKLVLTVTKNVEVLNKQAPLTRKLLRVNHALHISNSLRNAIMKRSYT